MKFNIILAVDEKNWLWKKNKLPWSLPSDMKYFTDITTRTEKLWKINAVIMWRKTWESIPIKFKPLKNRVNCILTKKVLKNNIYSSLDNSVLYFSILEHCFFELDLKSNIENIFVIWWANLYNQVINHPNLDKIYLTKIKWDFNCDVFFNWVPDNFEVESKTDIQNENNIEYNFWVYKKKS
jgi:dihydrofolate reductase